MGKNKKEKCPEEQGHKTYQKKEEKEEKIQHAEMLRRMEYKRAKNLLGAGLHWTVSTH